MRHLLETKLHQGQLSVMRSTGQWKSAIAAAFSLLWLALPAFGAGTISTLSANPTATTVGGTVDFSVEGTGTCELLLQFGDGESEMLNAVTLPYSTTHTYQAVGTFTASASAPDCPVQGQGQVEIEVTKGGGTRLEVLRNPGDRLLVAMRPIILRAFGWGIQPGGGLLIGGLKFGDDQGTLWFVGDNGQFKALEVEHWFDDAIGGLVPQDIHTICVTGIQVESADGELSAVFPVAVPTEVRILPIQDVAVLQCDDDGDSNVCNGESTTTEDVFSCVEAWHTPLGSIIEFNEALSEFEAGQSGAEPVSLGASHRNCWGAFADDSGTDRYGISLRNGWRLDDAQFFSRVVTGDADEGSTTPASGTLPGGFVVGATSWQPSINWTVSANDTIVYGLRVFIRGPACSSHK